MRRVLKIFGALVIVILIVSGVSVWWFVYRPLPQVDGMATLTGLKAKVTVQRDNWGIPHIRAASLEDLAEAQGYVMAQDRLWQMDLLRRAGRGQLSEVLGAATLPVDKEFRVLGFARAAEREAAALAGENRTIVEAYARGVNAFIDAHRDRLPLEFSLLKYKPSPWTPADTFIITAYMYQTLTDTWEDEFNRAKLTEKVGAERAKDLFSPEAAMDHFVVGGPDQKKNEAQRAHADENDDDDDMQSDDVTTTRNFEASESGRPASGPIDLTTEMAISASNFFEGAKREIRSGLGSNNWVVSGAKTATGKPLLANDTHLELSVPSIWYEAHLTAPGWNVTGVTLPGAPMVVIGHNDQIAWGFTNNGADVQDLYIETFKTGTDEYRVNGSWTAAQVVDEVIRVKGQQDTHFKTVITRHGPVVRRIGDVGYALRWTATEPGGLSNTYNGLGKARNWNEFLSVMKGAWGPAQNTVYADASGNIGYVMAARVPIRKKSHGEVPVPGDMDDYEWSGYVPFEQLPQVLNPESGMIVTANARVAGPNYKPYLTDRWEEPYRTARITELLDGKANLRPEDMLRIQNDTYCYPYFFLAEQLMAANKNTQPKDSRAKSLIAGLKDWNGIAEANSTAPSFLNAVRRTAMDIVLEPYLGKDTDLYEWRRMAFLQRLLTERPAKWLPSAYKNYDELLMAAADRAVARLAEQSGRAGVEDWTWAKFNALQMLHPIGQTGILRRLLSIADTPQPGTAYSVRAATRRHGPSMRFVANAGDWDNSILLIPTGESGQLGSGHYTDQFSFWFDGKEIRSPFSDAAEAKSVRHTLTLNP